MWLTATSTSRKVAAHPAASNGGDKTGIGRWPGFGNAVVNSVWLNLLDLKKLIYNISRVASPFESLTTNMMLLVGVLHFVTSCWWYETRREHENQKWDNFWEVVWLPYHGFYWSHLDSMVSPIYQSLLRGLGCAIKAGLILSLRSSQSLFSTKSIGPWQLLLKKTRYPVKVDCIPHTNSISWFNWE